MQTKETFTKMKWPVSVWILIVFLLTGWILNIVSLVIPYWNKAKHAEPVVHWGLWQMCEETTGCEIISNKNLTDIMQIGRAFLVTSSVCYIVLLTLVVLYLFWRNNPRLLLAAAVTSFLTLVGLFLGAILWMTADNTTIYWSFYMSFASAFLVSGSCGVILHVRRQQKFSIVEFQEQHVDYVI